MLYIFWTNFGGQKNVFSSKLNNFHKNENKPCDQIGRTQGVKASSDICYDNDNLLKVFERHIIVTSFYHMRKPLEDLLRFERSMIRYGLKNKLINKFLCNSASTKFCWNFGRVSLASKSNQNFVQPGRNLGLVFYLNEEIEKKWKRFQISMTC